MLNSCHGPAAEDHVQSDMVTECRPHVGKPADLHRLYELTFARIVDEDAVIARGG